MDKQKASEGQQIARAISECVNNIQEDLVTFARLVYLLIEDSDLRLAAGWDSEEEMFNDPVVKQGFGYAISLDSEWQVYRLKRMLRVDAQMPEAGILEVGAWTNITQTSKIKELEELAATSGLDNLEKIQKAAEIIVRPRNEPNPDEKEHLVEYDESSHILFVDGSPVLRFTTNDNKKLIRTVSRLLHDADGFALSGNRLMAQGAESREIATFICGDEELNMWVARKLKAKKMAY